MNFRWLTFLYLIFPAGTFVLAACPAEKDLELNAQEYLNKQPLGSYDETLSMAEAYCAQQKFVKLINHARQPVIGYKVSMTNKAIQDRFRISEPVSGILLENMILPDGSSLNKGFAFRPFLEADMIVIVKDKEIMNAQNELEVAAHLDTLHAFIELPDIPFKKEVILTAPTLVAFNIAARAGVYGQGLKIKATPEFVNALPDMQAVLTDESGQVLLTASASNLLRHPFRVVLWLINELESREESLHAGQIISLGSLGKMIPLRESGKTYTLTYKGLPGTPISTTIHIK